MTNCKNCGAVLVGNKCEYCGTDYGRLYTKYREPMQEDRATVRVFDNGKWKWIDEAMLLSQFGVYKI